MENPEGWKTKKKILAIFAHPDDAEFFCGGMIARWVDQGHCVSYCLLTKGQRGFHEKGMDLTTMAEIRVREQMAAGSVLGVTDIRFLEHLDGELVADIALREEIIQEIRKRKPDIVVSCDPTNLFPAVNRINHPDHRAAGQAVIDAVFPAAGSPAYQFNDKLTATEAHQVEEMWLALTQQPNFEIVLTNYLEKRIRAILCHHSQVQATAEELLDKYLKPSLAKEGADAPAYCEKFLRIIFN